MIELIGYACLAALGLYGLEVAFFRPLYNLKNKSKE